MTVQSLSLAIEGLEALDLAGMRHQSAVPRVSFDDLGVLLDLRRRAVGDFAAKVDGDDLVGNLHDQAHVMLDQQAQ